jgi:Flp pilus assembly protein TadD
MPPEESDEVARSARRWADAAWQRGLYAHAIDVLDHAIRLCPTDFKLYRKRGAFCLLCPDPDVRDEHQGVTDLRRACELSGWRDDLVRWAAETLADAGYRAEARDLLRELPGHGPRAAGAPDAGGK